MSEVVYLMNSHETCKFMENLQQGAQTSRHLAGLLGCLKTLSENETPDPQRSEAWVCALYLCAALEPEGSAIFGHHAKRPDLRTSAAWAANLLERLPSDRAARIHALKIYKALAGESKKLKSIIDPVSLPEVAAEAAYLLFQNAA